MNDQEKEKLLLDFIRDYMEYKEKLLIPERKVELIEPSWNFKSREQVLGRVYRTKSLPMINLSKKKGK